MYDMEVEIKLSWRQWGLTGREGKARQEDGYLLNM